MKIRVGYELVFDFPQSTPVIMVLGTHFTRASDIIVPDFLTTSPSVPISPYRDVFGNWCSRIVAPAGRIRLSADGVVRDTGLPDVVAPSASQHAVEDLPAETLIFLLGSRYCETDPLSDVAWSLFEKSPPGWARVQAICDFVHRHIAFGYEHARATMTAWEVFNEGKGVCRDLRPPRHHVLPLHEHSGALLHRLPRRHRHAAALWPNGFRRLVRGLSWRAVVHIRRAQQHAANRPRTDRSRARCGRRADHPHLRPQHAGQFQGLDGRGQLDPRGIKIATRTNRPPPPMILVLRPYQPASRISSCPTIPPVVLSPEEVARLLEAAPGVKYKAALSVAYGAGLRVSEVVSLKVSDIDSKRMMLRVEQGKGGKDRHAMLSPQLLELLRDWWRIARP